MESISSSSSSSIGTLLDPSPEAWQPTLPLIHIIE